MKTDGTGRRNHRMTDELKASLDGELSVFRAGRVRLHLMKCASCREERAWLRRLGSEMKELERATPRPELRAKILASLPDAPPVTVAANRSRQEIFGARSASPRYAFGVAALGVLCVLMTGGVYAYRRLNGSPSAVAQTPEVASRRPSPVALPKPAKTPELSAGIRETISIAPLPNDPYSAQASRMVAEDLKRERIGREKLKLEERHRREILASQGKPAVETPVLKLASAEGGATGEGFLNRFRETVARVDGKVSGVAVSPRQAKLMPNEREVAVRVPAEKVEEFLTSLTSVGLLTKATEKPEVGPHAYAIATNDDIKMHIPHQVGSTYATGIHQNVVVVQPDRKGYVLLHVRLTP